MPALVPEAAADLHMISGKPDHKSDETTSIRDRDPFPETPALPPSKLLELQSGWLAPARSRLLRRIAIANKERILDLGAGYGHVSSELARRSSGKVVAFDIELLSLREAAHGDKVIRVAGNGSQLPFHPASFELVFCQCALLWMNPIAVTAKEIFRVLEPGGVLVALEPDYAGLIEHPPEIACRELWLKGLIRAGAEPRIGRILPGLLESIGFSVKVNLLERLQQPAKERLIFLAGLPLTESENVKLRQIQDLSTVTKQLGWQQISHLPFFLITASKP